MPNVQTPSPHLLNSYTKEGWGKGGGGGSNEQELLYTSPAHFVPRLDPGIFPTTFLIPELHNKLATECVGSEFFQILLSVQFWQQRLECAVLATKTGMCSFGNKDWNVQFWQQRLECTVLATKTGMCTHACAHT